MGGEEGHIQTPAAPLQLGIGGGKPRFRFELQAVAGLAFQVDHPPFPEGPQAVLTGGHQLVHSGAAGGANGLADAAALSGDLLVADPMEAPVEFAAAVAPEEQVRVGIHESWRGPGPAAIHLGRIQPVRGQVRRPAHPGHVAALQGQGRIRDAVHPPGPGGIGGQQAPEVDEYAAIRHGSSLPAMFSLQVSCAGALAC
ncbi:MAG TPA: hypothetical protein DHV93_00160 [Holophagaceae bacterium]|nr:hypothetical protein [Holophagaceae bacterium]